MRKGVGSSDQPIGIRQGCLLNLCYVLIDIPAMKEDARLLATGFDEVLQAGDTIRLSAWVQRLQQRSRATQRPHRPDVNSTSATPSACVFPFMPIACRVRRDPRSSDVAVGHEIRRERLALPRPPKASVVIVNQWNIGRGLVRYHRRAGGFAAGIEQHSWPANVGDAGGERAFAAVSCQGSRTYSLRPRANCGQSFLSFDCDLDPQSVTMTAHPPTVVPPSWQRTKELRAQRAQRKPFLSFVLPQATRITDDGFRVVCVTQGQVWV